VTANVPYDVRIQEVDFTRKSYNGCFSRTRVMKIDEFGKIIFNAVASLESLNLSQMIKIVFNYY